MSNVPKQKTGRCRVMQVLRYQPVHRYDTNPCTQQAERIALLRAAKARGLIPNPGVYLEYETITHNPTPVG
jgi:hypothetical protein